MITVDSPLIGQADPLGEHEALAYVFRATGEAVPLAVAEYMAELYRLCALVGLDASILAAQAAHETDNFTSFWWRTRLNPAGIGITGDPKQNDASQTWANGTDAARGHVAHMVAYVGAFSLRHLNTYDQRWQHVLNQPWAGTIRTIRDLTGKWATDPAYHDKIVAKHRAIFGVQEAPLSKPTILVIAGHRSYNDAGNPIEKGLTPGIAAAYRDAFRAAGYDVTWLQEADGDNDPDDTVGGLDTVSRKAGEWCAKQQNGVLLDLHFEGTAPQIRGVFAIIPDVTGLRTGAPVIQLSTDTWEGNTRDRELGQAITNGISALTGLPIRGGLRAPGLMDESQTGVGGQGWRLATFAYTSPWHGKVVRLVIEHGAFTNPQDLAIIKSPGFNQKCAQAAVNAVNAVYGVKPGKPDPAKPEPSPIWWEPGDQWGPQKRSHDGAIAWAFLGEVTAKRTVPIRRDAHSKADVVHRMKPGEKARIVGTYVAANKQRWAFIEYAPGKIGRALLSAFDPYRWPTV